MTVCWARGGLTATVLPIFPADRCAYTFTDVSPAFLQAARDRFEDFDFVEYATLDLEKDLVEQGFQPGAFDLVLAANVVHVTADLIATLTSLRACSRRTASWPWSRRCPATGGWT